MLFSCYQIWNPDLAEERIRGNSINFLAKTNTPLNVRYDIERFDEEGIVDYITPAYSSDWSEDQRREFQLEMFRLRKDLREVSKSMRKDMGNCMAYYLATYKSSDEYRLLKTIHHEERIRRMMGADHGLDSCAICGDGGNLLICDGCEGEYHMECLRPVLKSVPEGQWNCDECCDRAFLAAKDSMIRKYEEKDVRLNPTSPARAIVARLAENVSAALAEGLSTGNDDSIPSV